MIALLLAGSIAGSVEGAVTKTLQEQPLVLATASELEPLKRRIFGSELNGEVTAVIGDATALDIISMGFDTGTTGWGIANGAVEQNPVLGKSKTNALIILGTKVVGMGTVYFIRRSQMRAWKACMLRVYDGSLETCGQKDTVKRMNKITTSLLGGLGAWNSAVAIREGAK